VSVDEHALRRLPVDLSCVHDQRRLDVPFASISSPAGASRDNPVIARIDTSASSVSCSVGTKAKKRVEPCGEDDTAKRNQGKRLITASGGRCRAF